jgi:hypothetical protein
MNITLHYTASGKILFHLPPIVLILLVHCYLFIYFRYLLAHKVCHFAHTLHLLQMLVGMVRMNHLVLNRHIVATKDLNGIATGMVKVVEVVNDSVNAHFVALERTQTRNAFRLGRHGGAVIVGRLALA